MMKSVICLFALVVVSRALIEEHGADLMQIIDWGFNFFDKDHDGFITLTEFNVFVDDEDANHDGFVTLEEYMGYFNMTREVAEPIFSAIDNDNDGKIADNAFANGILVMDTNSDGKVSLTEYEQFEKGFLQCVFSNHGNHGHGADCNSYHHGRR